MGAFALLIAIGGFAAFRLYGQFGSVFTTDTDKIEEVTSDFSQEFGIDLGLRRDGVEAHFQILLADKPVVIEAGLEQLAQYLERHDNDALLAPVRGIFVTQIIAPQASTLAEAQGMTWVEVDYDELRVIESNIPRLF